MWGFVDIGGGGEEVQEIESPDFRSPEVGISVIGAIQNPEKWNIKEWSKLNLFQSHLLVT